MVSKVLIVALSIAVALSTAQSTTVVPIESSAGSTATAPSVNSTIPSVSSTVGGATSSGSSVSPPTVNSSTIAPSTTTQSAHGIKMFFAFAPVILSMLI